jgi:hypothetical protein
MLAAANIVYCLRFYVRHLGDEFSCIIYIKLTPGSWVLLEKTPVTQQHKNLPIFFGTHIISTVHTRVGRQSSLSWARPIRSIPPHSSPLISILILSSRLRLFLPSCTIFSGFHTKTIYVYIPLLACYMSCTSHPPWLYSKYDTQVS